jgi:aryl-alcohol dehydrogenase-like predicted oxidoreductase
LRLRRDEVFLATKVHFPMGADPNARGNSGRHIVEQCEASLRRLGTDRIDLYQLHAFDPDVPIDESLNALDNLTRRGLIRYGGASGFPPWRHVEAMWAASQSRLRRLVSEQPPYNLLDRRIERELIPMVQTYDLAVIIWSPLAGGYLCGQYRPNAGPPAGSRFDTFWREWGKEHDKPSVHEVVTGLEALAADKGCSPSALALAWVMHQPGVTAPIIGPRTLPQLEAAIAACQIGVTEDDRQRVDKLVPPGQAVVPYYGGGAELWDSWKASARAWR